MKIARLVMVTAQNNYKYYFMTQIDENKFKAEWGRIEVNHYEKIYPMSKWDSIYGSKIGKGYMDHTELHRAENAAETAAFNTISNKDVKNLILALQKYAKEAVLQNYAVSSSTVTLKRVEKAQILIDDIANMIAIDSDTDSINKKYLELLGVITRRLQRVQDILFNEINTEEDLQEAQRKIANEQSILDAMRGQIETEVETQEIGSNNILEQFDLEIHPCSPEEEMMIKEMMEENASMFSRAFRVEKKDRSENFEEFISKAEDKSIHLLWHGSRNENWWNILKTGLILRPANAVINGKVFGYGIYFANKFRKSFRYCSCRGSYLTQDTENKCYIGIFEVHRGCELQIQDHQDWCYNLNEENLRNQGNYDSLYAPGIPGVRDSDYVVYNQKQCTIKYLVEVVTSN
ncbi:MAG: ADP-ribose polymerase [Candidatus Hermodarchaeota archaeon]